jgi:nucleotide-binding universal stress UspA family protein
MAESMEGCVMLALSTFRKSEQAIDTAIQKAKSPRKLLIVFVADINLARYFIGAEDGLSPDMRDICESDLLEFHMKEGRHHVEEIAARARQEDIEVKSFVNIGRFTPVCLDFVKEVNPSLIVTTRSRRPEWVKRFFGSPVDELIEKAGCPVVVV